MSPSALSHTMLDLLLVLCSEGYLAIYRQNPASNATVLIGGIFTRAAADITNFHAFCFLWFTIGTAAEETSQATRSSFQNLFPG